MKRFIVPLLLLLSLVSEAAAGEYSKSVLVNLRGVGLEVRPVNIQAEEFELKTETVEAHVLAQLKELDVRLLTDIELDVMPGQPYLEVSIDVIHAQGPSHIYSVRLELKEMAQLERPRDSIVMMALTTWQQQSLGIANRPETILSILEKLLQRFSMEMKEMNAK